MIAISGDTVIIRNETLSGVDIRDTHIGVVIENCAFKNSETKEREFTNTDA